MVAKQQATPPIPYRLGGAPTKVSAALRAWIATTGVITEELENRGTDPGTVMVRHIARALGARRSVIAGVVNGATPDPWTASKIERLLRSEPGALSEPGVEDVQRPIDFLADRRLTVRQAEALNAILLHERP